MSLPAAFVSVILIWSTTPLAIKWSAAGVSSSFSVLLRMLIGVMLCAALLALFRVQLPLHRKALQAYLIGGLSMFSAMALTYWSAQYVSSGMIALLFGLSPLITSLGAMMWLKEETLTPSKTAGMLLGMLGLALVFKGGFSGQGNLLAGLAALLLAVVAQALGLVWLKRIGDDSPPLATTFGILLVALPLFFAAWYWEDGHMPSVWPSRAMAAIMYLGSFGSVLGFALYYYLIKHMEAGRIALITLMTPVLALLLGHGLNNEEIQLHVWFGTGCILLGLGVHRWGSLWVQRFSSK